MGDNWIDNWIKNIESVENFLKKLIVQFDYWLSNLGCQLDGRPLITQGYYTTIWFYYLIFCEIKYINIYKVCFKSFEIQKFFHMSMIFVKTNITKNKKKYIYKMYM